MKRDELLAKMRARIDLCRNLARTTDPTTAKALTDIADEGERDYQRLLTEKDE